MPDVVVRPKTPDDVDAELDILEAVGAEGRWLGIEVPFDRSARAERIREDLAQPASSGAFVAEVGGNIVGFINMMGLQLDGD